MSLLLNRLHTKADLDKAITSTEDLVLVLRFGRHDDITCMQLDEILYRTADKLSLMCKIYVVEWEDVPEYISYFDISLIPSTLFFFNAQHIRVDWGTPDHTKFVGSFKTKQDFIDVVEVIYRGALRGKLTIQSPLDPANVPKYELIYKDI